jgi:hypothetical protein
MRLGLICATHLLRGLVIAGILLEGCSSPSGSSGGGASTPNRVTCPAGIAAEGALAGQASGVEPDFGLYGFPRVAATEQFTPGSELQIRSGPISLTVPPDLYTDPLRFELLVGDEPSWQRCVAEDRVVVAPYAFRITDPATGNRVGRIDKPVAATIADPRIGAGAVFWTTSPTSPPVAEQASAQPPVAGNTIRPTNANARIGWFTTVPKQ